MSDLVAYLFVLLAGGPFIWAVWTMRQPVETLRKRCSTLAPDLGQCLLDDGHLQAPHHEPHSAPFEGGFVHWVGDLYAPRLILKKKLAAFRGI